ncbi:MAG: inorganic diphosphatase [bacterium]|nr:inorganic diphosphatase [bacterium]
MKATRGSLPAKHAWLALFAVGLGCSGWAGCADPNHLLDRDPVNPDLTIHVVVENPAGSSEKWEVRPDGRLERDYDAGVPIEIQYLPWPVNGGMMPRTLHAAELGGDGEPLDVLLLGPAVARGTTLRARPIGLLRVLDSLERDDKILAVPETGVFAGIETCDELERRHPGVREILARWFEYSRPGGVVEVQGYATREAAALLIEDAVRAFDEALANGALPSWKNP